MKKISLLKSFLPVLILMSLVFCISAGGTETKQSKTFTWTMALQNVKTDSLEPFSAPVKSSAGDKFRLIINPGTACYCYIISESADGDDVAVLQAGPLKGGETWYSPVMEFTPPGGKESLFVVASREEQSTLAQRVSAFNSNSGTVQRRALLNEVFRLRSEISQYRETPEKPVLMGGAARGTPGKNEGVEFTGLETYVKTISIEH